MLLDISGEITPENMKGWSQRKKQHPVVDVIGVEARSDAVRSNIAQEPGMLGP